MTDISESDLNTIGESFRAFHAQFADLFGRTEAREKSLLFAQGLLIQSEERRSAENIAEVVPKSARSLQRFLTDSHWPDRELIRRLQEVMAPRLNDPQGVWVLDETGFGKQGTHSVGVARQYSGTLGRIGNCQIGVFLAYVGPRGRLLVDKELYLPAAWVNDAKRCDRCDVPTDERTYLSKTQLALRMLLRARAIGALTSQWITGDDHYGQSPEFRDSLAAAEFLYVLYVLEVPKTTPVWPSRITWSPAPAYNGSGRPRKAQIEQVRDTVEAYAKATPGSDWRTIAVGEGSQGVKEYRFCAMRVRDSQERRPGEQAWLVGRTNRDGSEPRYYLSNAPSDTSLEQLAHVATSRWPIETEFEETKAYVGLDEYEVRSWRGWHHHIAMCLLANAFLLTVQLTVRREGASLPQDAKKKSTRDRVAAACLLDGPITDAAPGVSIGAGTSAQASLDTCRPAALAIGHTIRERTREALSC